MVSIHKHQVKDFVQEIDLKRVIHELKLRVPKMHTLSLRYELGGKYRQLHAHFIAKVHKDFRYGKYSKFNGYRIHWLIVNRMEGIVRYINKETRTYDEKQHLMWDNMANHSYLFNEK